LNRRQFSRAICKNASAGSCSAESCQNFDFVNSTRAKVNGGGADKEGPLSISTNSKRHANGNGLLPL